MSAMALENDLGLFSWHHRAEVLQNVFFDLLGLQLGLVTAADPDLNTIAFNWLRFSITAFVENTNTGNEVDIRKLSSGDLVNKFFPDFLNWFYTISF